MATSQREEEQERSGSDGEEHPDDPKTIAAYRSEWRFIGDQRRAGESMADTLRRLLPNDDP